jgi:hypothetical protein
VGVLAVIGVSMIGNRQAAAVRGLLDELEGSSNNAPGSPSPDPGIVGNGSLVPLSTTAVTQLPTNLCTDPVFQVSTQGCSAGNYFLGTSATPKYGYYETFPIPFPMSPAAPASTFLSKGINPPLVVSNSLSYSYFTPLTSDPCNGGAGNTYSWFIADVLRPIIDDQRAGMNTPSGSTMAWNGVASNFMAAGTTTIIQSGMIIGGNGTPTPFIKSTPAPSTSLYPRARVWRTVP